LGFCIHVLANHAVRAWHDGSVMMGLLLIMIMMIVAHRVGIISCGFI